MKLRTRLAVTTIAVAIPVAGAMLWIDAYVRHLAAKEGLAEAAVRYMRQPGERERCEREATHWGGRPLPPPRFPGANEGPPRGPPGMHGRPPPGPPGTHGGPPPGPDMRSSGDRPGIAPPVLYAYDEALHARNPRAPQLSGPPEQALWPGSVVHVLVATPWKTGPCAYVLARGSTNPRWLGALLPQSPIWLLPVGFVLLALLITFGPVVQRIRRLMKAVDESAAAGFTLRVNVEGEDEIAELARAFQAASAEVQRQLADKDRREQTLRDFLANTTHDLLIPLTVLKSHLASIHEQRVAGLTVDLETISHAMSETHYIGALTQNLAIAAKLDAGEPEILRLPVDLCALVERVLGRHRPIARQLEMGLEGAVPEEALSVQGDVTLIEQAVNNIVYNALRYNRAGGHVAVTLDRLSADRFRLRVVDDGPGVPIEQISRIAERGFRGDTARTRAKSGQGLGLNIAFRVAQVLRLQLSFAPSEYGGLQVDLTGPLER